VLDQVRFETAKRMLQDGGMSITDISQRLGYSDATHFSRAFRRVVGVAPNLYRQQSLQ
jgi:AraC-like DNA-binding protein